MVVTIQLYVLFSTNRCLNYDKQVHEPPYYIVFVVCNLTCSWRIGKSYNHINCWEKMWHFNFIRKWCKKNIWPIGDDDEEKRNHNFFLCLNTQKWNDVSLLTVSIGFDYTGADKSAQINKTYINRKETKRNLFIYFLAYQFGMDETKKRRRKIWILL